MELIFENVKNSKKGGALAGASLSAGRGGVTGASLSAGRGGVTGASLSAGRGGVTGASLSAGSETGAGMTGAGKRYNGVQLGKIARHHTHLYGGGWFGDFCDGFKQGFTGVMNVALPVLDIIPGMSAVTKPLKMVSGIMGGKKPRRVRGGTDALAEEQGKEAFEKLFKESNAKKAQVGGRKPAGNKTRIEIVKGIMAKKKLSLMEASSYVKTHNLYKK
jgi:hypothetical protein